MTQSVMDEAEDGLPQKKGEQPREVKTEHEHTCGTS